MHYHIILTHICNSQCKYCYEKSMKEENDMGKRFHFDFSSLDSSAVSVEKLKKFIAKDGNPTIEFYGGEPLLEIDKIKEIMDNIDVPFRMQTNGKLLDKIPMAYLKRIGKILVSIDGDRERTDYNRGKGTYDKVIGNLKMIRSRGYEGEIVARMVISPEHGDLYEQVKHILEIGEIDSVHWQIDAGFYKCDYEPIQFSKFVKEYNKSVSKLIDFWISEMKKGKVIMLYPFAAIVDSILKGEKTKLRCGAGHSGYAIGTSGKIYACPIMNCVREFEAGDLDSNPRKLRKFDVFGDCDCCDVKDLCGGRCLYWHSVKLWPKEGNEMICDTIKHLIGELGKRIPEIRGMIDKGIIGKEDFGYEKYFGPEIIP